MKNRCVIVAGGDCIVKSFSKFTNDDYIIAADSGLKYCVDSGVKPDLLVGDFDSYLGELPQDVETVRLPTHKDDTDLLFAVRCALEKGFVSILILGGYGSRPDQNLAMLQTLAFVKNTNPDVEIKAECVGFDVFAVCNGSIEFKKNTDRYLSVFAFEKASGVSVVGAEYELCDAEIDAFYPIGVSNISVEDTIVSVKNGTLIIMCVDKNI